MSIENDRQLVQSREVLTAIEESLASLRRRIEPTNTALFQALAEDYVDDIFRLRAEIDAYVGTTAALESRAPLWYQLEGPGLTASNAPSRLLSDWLDRLRKSVLNVTEFLQTRRIRPAGRPSSLLVDATDFRLVAFAEGSIRIGLRLPPLFVQDDAFPQDTVPEPAPREAVERLLEMALWAQSDAVQPPLETFPDRDEAALVADQLSYLVPSGRGPVRSIAFSGAIVPSHAPVRLQPTVRQRLRGLIQILSTVTEEEAVGTIREIDLDAQRIILRERGPGAPDLKCYLPDELMQTAEDLLDKVVRVRGLISSATPTSIDVVAITPVS